VVGGGILGLPREEHADMETCFRRECVERLVVANFQLLILGVASARRA